MLTISTNDHKHSLFSQLQRLFLSYHTHNSEMDSRHAASPSPPGGVFIRVASLQSPVAIPIVDGMSVAELRRSFLIAYRERVPPPTSPTTTTTECRLVCRGKELLDSAALDGLVRSGDHLHAIVREIEIAVDPSPPSRQQAQPLLATSTESLRRNAQSLVEEINRIMQARNDEQQRQRQQDDDRVATTLRGRHHHASGGAPPAALSVGSHQQVSRLTQPPPPATTPTFAGAAPPAAPTAAAEYGGIDGATQILPFDDSLFENRPTETISSATLLLTLTQISETPAVFLFGLCGGYFLGFLMILFVFARDLRADFRYGAAAGLALNVFLGMMLPHPTVAAFRNPPH
ncbi:transmembrane protein, putative [Bodo saltans]|uniref:Transmembrane protein, putative n=1 Tax=Bodo saltans TaxID=75058 RepID=A0A0S4JPA0_BODSA|nr:transmembrane protein, putative [Bodo saltans]|eukprot:CUG91971.1 transmembrane protein, putative [Bodo saltans]